MEVLSPECRHSPGASACPLVKRGPGAERKCGYRWRKVRCNNVCVSAGQRCRRQREETAWGRWWPPPSTPTVMHRANPPNTIIISCTVYTSDPANPCPALDVIGRAPGECVRSDWMSNSALKSTETTSETPSETCPDTLSFMHRTKNQKIYISDVAASAVRNAVAGPWSPSTRKLPGLSASCWDRDIDFVQIVSLLIEHNNLPKNHHVSTSSRIRLTPGIYNVKIEFYSFAFVHIFNLFGKLLAIFCW